MNLHNVKVGDGLIVIRELNAKRVVVTKINIRDVATTEGRFMKDDGKAHGANMWHAEYAYPLNPESVERERKVRLLRKATMLCRNLRSLEVIAPSEMTPERVDAFEKWLASCPVRDVA